MKKLFAVVLTLVLMLACVFTLVACDNKQLEIWVGEESQAYYTKVLQKYVEDYEAKNGTAFPYTVIVKGVDSSTAAAAITKDAQAGPAIFTVPHDNIGKLLGTTPVIAALTSPTLLAQIDADNPDSYKSVIKSGSFTVAVPYIGQSLVLFYDKSKVTAEEAKTWEGLMAAAKRANAKATTVMGNDSFNLSFFMLARNAETKATSVKIYEADTVDDMLTHAACHCTGDDTMANFKWAQRFFNDPNGGQLAGSDSFEVLLKNGSALSLIGGAWKYNGVSAALGSNLGIAQLPTYTITEADAYGTCTAGTVMKSGTFADCKVLCLNAMNKVVEKGDKQLCEDIMQYMSSKEIQEGSFEECNNLPAYKNALTEFEAMKADTNEALLARTQIEMSDWGIAQPFGFASTLNFYFYQKGADTYTQDMILMRDTSNNIEPGNAYNTDEKLMAGLQIIENLWWSGLPEGKK